jgi:hypothetical protein
MKLDHNLTILSAYTTQFNVDLTLLDTKVFEVYYLASCLVFDPRANGQ